MGEIQALFDARLDVRPPVGEDPLAAIPAQRGVVLLTGPNDRPIVLITAADMRSRTRYRLAKPLEEQQAPSGKSPDLRQITRRVYWRRCESHFETDWRRLEIARRIWPQRFAEGVAWRAPWFIHLNRAAADPHFARTREAFGATARKGRCFGPFASGADADRFLDALADAFDLCRSVSCLRRAPHGPRCAYAEMGRCAGPADGTISMDEYRDILARAEDFVAGDREGRRAELRVRMQAAAKRQAYEQASVCKTRLDRLDLFEQAPYRWVAPAERFAFLLVQRGAGVREARAFLAYRGAIHYAGPLAYPLQERQLTGLLRTMRRLCATDPPVDEIARLRIGLVARTLFASEDRRGLALPWREDLTAADLAESIEDHRELLRLRAPRKRGEDTGDTKRLGWQEPDNHVAQPPAEDIPSEPGCGISQNPPEA
jgi:SAM-dependent methyltransferase